MLPTINPNPKEQEQIPKPKQYKQQVIVQRKGNHNSQQRRNYDSRQESKKAQRAQIVMCQNKGTTTPEKKHLMTTKGTTAPDKQISK